MQSTTRVFLRDDEGEKFFGEGPCRLLHGVERTGSLRAAAKEMEMAYTKALRLVAHAEEVLGFPLTERFIGGKGGGGSRLTPAAKAFISKYEAYRDACYAANDAIYREIFSDQRPTLGCVLMASGMGTRFGSNKLLAPFRGNPLIYQILAATDTPLISKRIVVTRHPEIAALCQEKGVQAVLHDQPYRNDTVRIGLESFGKHAPDGCMFCPCDQPLLSKETVEAMARAFQDQPEAIHRLAYQNTPGSPLIFPKRCYPALKILPQGKGGSFVAKAPGEQVCYVEAASAWELKDADTPEDLGLLETTCSRP